MLAATRAKMLPSLLRFDYVINGDLVGCAHTPIAAAHRSRSLGAIDPSPQRPFAAFLLSSYLDAATFCPIDQRAKSLSYKVSTQFLRSYFLTSKTPLSANEITGTQHMFWGTRTYGPPEPVTQARQLMGLGTAQQIPIYPEL